MFQKQEIPMQQEEENTGDSFVHCHGELVVVRLQ
jgi:hypothetical protein